MIAVCEGCGHWHFTADGRCMRCGWQPLTPARPPKIRPDQDNLARTERRERPNSQLGVPSKPIDLKRVMTTDRKSTDRRIDQ
jgi:hypothetical protein